MTEFAKPGDVHQNLADELRSVIGKAAMNAPRSRQSAVGLSEVGEPCIRKLAYKILDFDKTNRSSDPWPAIQGTAIHAWLAEQFSDVYDGEENQLYLVETPVKAAEGLEGTADLFDVRQGMVIDHKCVGATSMNNAKKRGMTEQQRVQINLYGLGFENAGYKVEKVALAFYPLGGRLDGMHTIVEAYNRKIATDAIQRYEHLQALVWQLDPENSPATWDLLPMTISYLCTYCPWLLPKSRNLSKGCPGEIVA
jgi:hypothetical protein